MSYWMHACKREVAGRRQLRRVNASGEQSATFYGILLRSLRVAVTFAKGVVQSPKFVIAFTRLSGAFYKTYERKLNFSTLTLWQLPSDCNHSEDYIQAKQRILLLFLYLKLFDISMYSTFFRYISLLLFYKIKKVTRMQFKRVLFNYISFLKIFTFKCRQWFNDLCFCLKFPASFCD